MTEEAERPPRRPLLVRLVPLVVVAALAAVVVALAFTLGRRSADDSATATTSATAPVDTLDPAATTTFLLTAQEADPELLADLATAVPVVMDGIYGIAGVQATAEADGVRVVLPVASRGAVLTDIATQFANLGVRAVKGTLGVEDQQLLKSIPGAYVCTAEAGTVPPADLMLYAPLCVRGQPTLAVEVTPEVLDRPAITTASASSSVTGWGISVTLSPGPRGADAWYALEERCAVSVQDTANDSEECPGGSVAILLGRFLLAQVDPVVGATPGGVIPLDLLDAGTGLDEAAANGYAAALRVGAAAPKLTVTPA